MTKIEILYNKLIKEFPQLEPYVYRGYSDHIYIGPHGGDIYGNVILLRDALIEVRWEPEPHDCGTGPAYKPTFVIDRLRPHIGEIMKLIQGFEKTANPVKKSDLLESLGFNKGSSNSGRMETDDIIIHVVDPYGGDGQTAACSGRLEIIDAELNKKSVIDRGGVTDLMVVKYFNTLDKLLNYSVNGVYS